MSNLLEWFIAGFPSIFRTASGDFIWIDFHSGTAPIAMSYRGCEFHFRSTKALADYFGQKSEQIEGSWEHSLPEWYTRRYQFTQKQAEQPAEIEETHTGVMVGFFLKPQDAEQLVVPGGEPTHEIHMTLTFHGDKSDLVAKNPNAVKLLCSTVQSFAQTHHAIQAQIAGYGRFTASPYNGTTPFIALVDSPELPAWREQLTRALWSAGFPHNMEHGYTPHITLAYVPENDPLPATSVPTFSFLFDSIAVAVGDTRYVYALAPLASAQ